MTHRRKAEERADFRTVGKALMRCSGGEQDRGSRRFDATATVAENLESWLKKDWKTLVKEIYIRDRGIRKKSDDKSLDEG